MESRTHVESSQAGWQDSVLWQTLSRRQGRRAKRLASDCGVILPDIEAVLRSGGTAPLDFTLHDAGHAFRVAERIVWLTSVDGLHRLSDDELALLLLASYLHDIGMTPPRQMIHELTSFLLGGDFDEAFASEASQLEAWLDESGGDGGDVSLPLNRSSDSLIQVQRLLAQYIRFRHVAVGDEWIASRLSGHVFGDAPHFLDDLRLLCRSHAQGYDELASDVFDVRAIGGSSDLLNLRYLALLLRVADVLEFDPERTPLVVFTHRGVSPESAVYWYKDHHISLLRDDDRLTVFALCPDARTHRAVELTCDAIEAELQIARRLADEHRLDIMPGLSKMLPYSWPLSGVLHREIRPRNREYEYIRGAFRPDTTRLLALLASRQFYRSEYAAVREVVANAFDAVKEQLGLQRLRLENPLDDAAVESLRLGHLVTLSVEETTEGIRVRCTDTGIGMSRRIIEERFLVAAGRAAPETLALERRCLARGFSTERSGQFGIGVLSYFGLAQHVGVFTQRSSHADDAEGCAWQFETDGVADWGELRRLALGPQGTSITLTIRQGLRGWSAERLLMEFSRFLQDELWDLPCPLEMRGADGSVMRIPAGRTRGPAYFAEHLDDMFRWYSGYMQPRQELVGKQTKRKIDRARASEEAEREEARRRLRWIAEEGVLPGGLGRYSLHIPWFELQAGASLAYLRVRRRGDAHFLERIGPGETFCAVPDARRFMSWRGWEVNAYPHHDEEEFGPDDDELDDDDREDDVAMRSENGREAEYNALGELLPWDLQEFGNPFVNGCGLVHFDWTSSDAAEIGVDRNDVALKQPAADAMRWVAARSAELVREFVAKNSQSMFHALNQRLLEEDGIVPAAWGHYTPGTPRADERIDRLQWRNVSVPATFAYDLHDERRGVPLVWRERDVTLLPCLSLFDDDSDAVTWSHLGVAPTHVAPIVDRQEILIPLWDATRRRSRRFGMLEAEYPVEWSQLLAGALFTRFTRGTTYQLNRTTEWGACVWNPAHPLVQSVSAEGRDWVRTHLLHHAYGYISVDPLEVRAEILKDPGRAAAFVTFLLRGTQLELWSALVERAPDMVDELGEVLFDRQWPRDREAFQCAFFVDEYDWDEGREDPCVLLLHRRGTREMPVDAADLAYGQVLPRPDLDSYVRARSS